MRSALGLFTAATVIVVAGCGGGGVPSADANKAIVEGVLTANSQMYSHGDVGAEVVGIQVGPWKKAERMGRADAGLPTMYESTWKAKLRTKEQLGVIIEVFDGTTIAGVALEKGAEIPFEGVISGMKADGKWEVHAFAKGEAWKETFEKTGPITMGYKVYDSRGGMNVAFRNTTFVPLSKLKPCVVAGSPEHKKMIADEQERQRKAMEAAQAAAEARRKAAEAEQKRRMEEQAERQRQQQAEYEERQRQQREAYEAAQKKAQEDAARRAEEARQARLRPLIAPFKSASGLLLPADLGPTLPLVLLAAEADDEKFTVKGTGIDLREMPFKEFSFTGTPDDRGLLNLASPASKDPAALRAGANGTLSGAGLVLSPLSPEDRAKFDATIALGKRLGSAAPASIAPEVLDPAAATAREANLQLAPLTGTVVYRNRVDARVNPMFAGDLKGRGQYLWRNGEVVLLRLAEPVKGSGIYFRGLNPSDKVSITINGVHKARLESVAKLGAAVIPLPSDLEVLEVRFEAEGTASVRTIGLIR
ncbi:MAG: hypothetical protein JNM80_02685 [Phycisphaerae bacterium]|nr:hypothetical protein [Phycisphaerae bacterium]